MDGDDATGLADEVPKARFYRTQGRHCDICEGSAGSVMVDRDDDIARCRTCFNDPETFES